MNDKVEILYNELVAIERKYATNLIFNIAAGAGALYLVREIGEAAYANQSLNVVLTSSKAPSTVKEFIVSCVGDHWHEYISLIHRFDSETIVDFFVLRVFVPANDEYYQSSDEICRLAVKLLEVKSRERCLDVCSGGGGFLEQLWMSLPLSENGCEFVAIERNPELVAISQLRYYINGIQAKVHGGDCFNPVWTRVAFDKVFCHPPFGLKVRDLGVLSIDRFVKNTFPDFPSVSLGSADWLFAARAVAAMKPDGIAVVAMPLSAMSGAAGEAYRRYFLERGKIECVISLARKQVGTPHVPTCLVIFKNGCSRVKLIDGESAEFELDGFVSSYQKVWESGYVATRQIGDLLSADADLNPRHLLQERVTYNGAHRLGDLCEIRRGVSLSSSDLASLTCDEDTGVKYLSVKGLTDGVVEFGTLPNLRTVEHRYLPSVANEGDVIISRTCSPFKASLVTETCGCRVVVGGNCYICRAKDVDPWFLVAFFNSARGAEVVDRMSEGAAMKMLPRRNLEMLPIPNVGKEEELRVAREYAELTRQMAELRETLAGLRAKREDVFGRT